MRDLIRYALEWVSAVCALRPDAGPEWIHGMLVGVAR